MSKQAIRKERNVIQLICKTTLGTGTCALPTSFRLIFTRESSYCFQHVLAIAILSIRLSVRRSHVWISQKRYNLGSPNLHRRLPGRL